MVELTVALHYLYKTPEDRVVWDVGHQTYPHKLLTARAESIHTVKRKGGVAPLPPSPPTASVCGHGPTTSPRAPPRTQRGTVPPPPRTPDGGFGTFPG